MKLFLAQDVRSRREILFKKSVVWPVLGILFIFSSSAIDTRQTTMSSLLDSKTQVDSINAHAKVPIQNWDIVFQTSRSEQSMAIQLATNSKYSHCGLVYRSNGCLFVLEAIQQVKLTSFEEWIDRGENRHYVIKRLRKSEQLLSPEVLGKMKKEGEKFLGKDYDLAFEWNDDKMYCSELVWKVYKRGIGLELGSLQKLSELELSNELVKEKLRQRYGSKIPLNEPLITPEAIFNSELLETVFVK